MKEKKEDQEALAKLVSLTKLMKAQKVKVSKLGPIKTTNKWRTAEPKFGSTPEKAEGTVEAGGMNVDPARKEEYENWRRDKEEEAKYRREQSEKKARAAAEARKKLQRPNLELP